MVNLISGFPRDYVLSVQQVLAPGKKPDVSQVDINETGIIRQRKTKQDAMLTRNNTTLIKPILFHE